MPINSTSPEDFNINNTGCNPVKKSAPFGTPKGFNVECKIPIFTANDHTDPNNT